jgi:hypothetical protein
MSLNGITFIRKVVRGGECNAIAILRLRLWMCVEYVDIKLHTRPRALF